MNENTAEMIKNTEQGALSRQKYERISVRDILRLAEMFELVRTLYRDVEFYSESLSETISPLMRRSYARALFAFVEGSTWMVKWMCSEVGEYHVGMYSPQEMYLLSEREVRPQVDGPRPSVENVWFREEPMKIGLGANLQFTFGMFAKMVGETYVIDKGTSGWAKFKRATEIRDRLMHPKSVSHVIVSDAELGVLMDAEDWFTSTLVEVCDIVKEKAPNDQPDIAAIEWHLFDFAGDAR